jgi:hypothetical protein
LSPATTAIASLMPLPHLLIEHMHGTSVPVKLAERTIASLIDRAHARNMCSSEIGKKEKNWLPRRPRGDSGVLSSGQAQGIPPALRQDLERE